MDIDVMGKHIHGLLEFKNKLEDMMQSPDDGQMAEALHAVFQFKGEFEAALPDLRKAIADVAVVIDDVGKIKADLAPVLAWIAEQQKAVEAVKAAEPPAHEPPASEAAHRESEQPAG